MTAYQPLHLSPDSDTTCQARVSAGKLVAEILSEIEFEDFLRATLYEVSGSHIQERQKQAGARISGCHAETVARWISGMTTPKARDFWSVAFMALLARFDADTQVRIAAEIISMCEGRA